MITASIFRRAYEEAAAFGTVADGVIKNCKVLGLASRNKARVIGLTEKDVGSAVDRPYRYSEAALRNAVPLYEGAPVYSDHLPFGVDAAGRRFAKRETHSNDELVGWLENVRFVHGKGLFGDLHYIQAHPMSSRLVEIAARKEALLKLSHEAQFGHVSVRGGHVYIDEILAVDAMALVSGEAGTNDSLFESMADSVSMFRRNASEPGSYMPILPRMSRLLGRGIP